MSAECPHISNHSLGELGEASPWTDLLEEFSSNLGSTHCCPLISHKRSNSTRPLSLYPVGWASPRLFQDLQEKPCFQSERSQHLPTAQTTLRNNLTSTSRRITSAATNPVNVQDCDIIPLRRFPPDRLSFPSHEKRSPTMAIDQGWRRWALLIHEIHTRRYRTFGLFRTFLDTFWTGDKEGPAIPLRFLK